MIKISTLFFFCALVFSQTITAKHIIGGIMSYEYVEGAQPGFNRYNFTLKVYRDCDPLAQGAGFDRPAIVSIGTSAGGYFMDWVNFGNPIVRPVINDFSNECLAIPPNICVQEGTYTRTMDLPVDTIHSYYIIYQRCCRNNTIFNILSPGEYGATYYIEITPEAQKLKNSSPQFLNFPPIAICATYPLVFDHSATDLDGDSLVYYFSSPIHGGGQAQGSSCNAIKPDPNCLPPYQNVVFRASFDAANPLGGSPTVTIDSVTGKLSGTPNAQGQFVVGVRVDEYRDGQLLSSTLRDFQFNIAACDKVVEAKIKSGTEEGDIIQFAICGDDPLFIENISGLESSIFNYNWFLDSPDSTFQLKTKDLSLAIPETGYYEGMMILNIGLQCSDTAMFSLTRHPAINANFEYSYDTCIATPIVFTNLSHSDAGLILSQQWFHSEELFSSDLHATLMPEVSGVLDIHLIVEDVNQCRDTLTQLINYFPIPPPDLLADTHLEGCIPFLVRFPDLNPNLTDSYTYQWDFGDGNQGDTKNPSHAYTVPGTYDISVDVVSQFGCTYSATFPGKVIAKDVPRSGFDYEPKELTNIKPGLHIIDNSSGAVKWKYDFGNGDTSSDPNPSYNYPDTGWHTVQQTVWHASGCIDSSTLLVDVAPIYTIYLPNAFRPDESGKNDVFRPAGNGFGLRQYTMTIFDRWGNEVFKTHDWNRGWDGTNGTGQQMPNGTYAVRVLVEGTRGQKDELFGTAILLR